MRKRNHIFLFGSAILGLTMSAMPVSADDAAATAPVSQASSVQVLPILIRPVSRDRLLIGRILPNIKDTYRFKFWGSMTFMVGFSIPVPLRLAIRPIRIRGRQKDWLAL